MNLLLVKNNKIIIYLTKKIKLTLLFQCDFEKKNFFYAVNSLDYEKEIMYLSEVGG